MQETIWSSVWLRMSVSEPSDAHFTIFWISSYFESFSRWHVRSMTDTLGIGKMPVNILFSSGMALPSALLGNISGCRDEVLGNPMGIMLQLSKGAIHSLLNGSDGKD
jgi:hypothetical protein